jgi:hypothetical protein
MQLQHHAVSCWRRGRPFVPEPNGRRPGSHRLRHRRVRASEQRRAQRRRRRIWHISCPAVAMRQILRDARLLRRNPRTVNRIVVRGSQCLGVLVLAVVFRASAQPAPSLPDQRAADLAALDRSVRDGSHGLPFHVVSAQRALAQIPAAGACPVAWVVRLGKPPSPVETSSADRCGDSNVSADSAPPPYRDPTAQARRPAGSRSTTRTRSHQSSARA